MENPRGDERNAQERIYEWTDKPGDLAADAAGAARLGTKQKHRWYR
ncbi:MAG: hypothetical protein HRU17_08420 [Polyangiaceae bacterium]|nr:hypothetical protein [Polyangiaceae bacterium]